MGSCKRICKYVWGVSRSMRTFSGSACLVELDEACTAANCCGVHIHVGMTCDTANDIGGHYWHLGLFDRPKCGLGWAQPLKACSTFPVFFAGGLDTQGLVGGCLKTWTVRLCEMQVQDGDGKKVRARGSTAVLPVKFVLFREVQSVLATA